MKEIPLTKGYKAIVDDSDYENINQYKWKVKRSKNTLYACRTIIVDSKICTEFMHRKILSLQFTDIDNIFVDHKDRNGLNNTRDNLRIATKSQNNMNKGLQENNSSGYKGVSYHLRTNKWQAYIKVNNKNICLGYYENIEDAISIRLTAEFEYFGEFA